LTANDTLTALTGLFVSEALHPFNVFRKSGFEVDFASETGTYKPDWLSLREDYLQGDDAKTWEDRSSEFRSRLDHLHKPCDVKAEQYGLFFAAGGHACLIDFPNARGLQGIAAEIYSAGGIVSAVCHGPTILPGITDAKTGKSIIAGTKVTGFTTKSEEELGALKTIKEKWNALTIEEATTQAGALCEVAST
jgi:putative intracellular protease/amidase